MPGFRCVPLLQALNGYNLDSDTVEPETRDLTSPGSSGDNNGADEEEEERRDREQSGERSPPTTESVIKTMSIHTCFVEPSYISNPKQGCTTGFDLESGRLKAN